MARINASSSVGVRVEGLRELNKALREIGPDAQKQLKETNLDVAQDVARDATGIAYGLGGVAAKTAPSIKAASRVVAAGVSFGSGMPWAMGAEFGGGRRSTTQQFKPWRGSGPQAGYFVYEAIRQDSEEIVEAYEDAIDKVLRENGLR